MQASLNWKSSDLSIEVYNPLLCWDIANFGALPIWEHRAIPKGRAFALKNEEGKDDNLVARDFLEYLDQLSYSMKGDSDFNPAELKITLKMTFAMEEEDLSKEDTAHVNIYKIKVTKLSDEQCK